MKQFTYVIHDPIGIHARPATILTMEAKNYLSEITFEANGKKANAKSMLKVMSLAVKQGNEVIVTVDGVDQDKAIARLEELFKENL